MLDSIGLLFLLFGLEIVLGIDNILVISIFVANFRLNRGKRQDFLVWFSLWLRE